ncbi:MAG: hypothetical protein COA77_08190 [Thaumarchaeota archaeon]|nr:MAG: hypothetical protein COA77_08190 [Nitrososphaerota archaeon]
MGLSNALSGGIILFGIVYVIFTFMGITDTAASFSDVRSQISDLENKLLKTSIVIVIEDDPGTNRDFNFNMTNTNSEKLWDWENFDVITTYENGGTTYTETLTYSPICNQIGYWCVHSWIVDVLDPEILNEGETLNIRAKVDNQLQADTTVIVIISTPNGVVASATRTV